MYIYTNGLRKPEATEGNSELNSGLVYRSYDDDRVSPKRTEATGAGLYFSHFVFCLLNHFSVVVSIRFPIMEVTVSQASLGDYSTFPLVPNPMVLASTRYSSTFYVTRDSYIVLCCFIV